ncbi:MAG: LytR C-terminal domain-containing protein [bacterium]
MLFGNTKIIIYLDSTKALVGDCRQAKPVFFEINHKGDLPQVFAKIIAKLPSSSYKIILGQSISYTVKLDNFISAHDRPLIKDELAKYIPENFEDHQFDWKIVGENQIEAIVITSEIYHALQHVRASHLSIKFETQSAISLLWEMGKSDEESEASPELFLFAAQKGPSRGQDEAVLNIEIDPTTEEPKSGSPIKPISRPKSNHFLAYLLIFLLLCASGAILWWYSNNQSFQLPVSPQSSPVPTSTPVMNLPKVPGDYKVLIQNGTKKSGLALDMKTKLTDLGFTQIETGNFSGTSLITTIQAKEALPDQVQQSILDSLSPLKPEISIGDVDISTSSSDIVITLGTK